MNHPVQYYYDSVRDIQQSQHIILSIWVSTFTNVLKCYVTRNPALACARNTLLFFISTEPVRFPFQRKIVAVWHRATPSRDKIDDIRTCSKIYNNNTHICLCTVLTPFRMFRYTWNSGLRNDIDVRTLVVFYCYAP